MSGSPTRSFQRIVFAALITTALSQAASAACYGPDKQMSPQAVSDFLANPSSLLTNPANAQGGDGFTNSIRDLVASNPSTLPVVIDLLKSANNAQQSAIGTGLGNAANLCNVPDPTFATEIAAQLAKATSTPAQIQFALATGKPIGSVGGGGAGGGVSAGGVGGSTTGSANGFSSGSTPAPFTSGGSPTSVTNYFTGGSAGAGALPQAANSVSQ